MKNRRKHRYINFMLMLFLCSYMIINVAWGSEDAEIHLTAILASHNSEYIDPGLESVAAEMQTLFRYSSYKKMKRYTVVLCETQSDRIILPEDNPLVVTYTGIDEKNRITILLSMADFFNTEFSVVDGGHILIGGPECQDGTLILLIEAKQ